MSDLNLACFVNYDRPSISDSVVTDLPLDAFTNDEIAQLQTSFQVNLSDLSACASSAGLWEDILALKRAPFLLLRVADMRYVLGSRVTAMGLYEELQVSLQNQRLQSWITRTREVIGIENENQLRLYKGDPSKSFTPSQRWIPTAATAVFPYCKMPGAQMAELRNFWQQLLLKSEDVRERYLNLHCLETNAIEGAVILDGSVLPQLLRQGFYNQNTPLISKQDIIGGVISSPDDALLVLRDTRSAFDEVLNLVGDGSKAPVLSVSLVCRLHEVLMRTSRVLSVRLGKNETITYVSAGVTRQASQVNVMAVQRAKDIKVQFAPFDEVDSELATFCDRFNEIIRREDVDPFACAAWISHVFVTIHPFEDGNGRLSRILSSIPLLRKKLPPLSVDLGMKNNYINNLNKVRANRDGDYSKLMTFLYLSTSTSVERLDALVDIETYLGI